MKNQKIITKNYKKLLKNKKLLKIIKTPLKKI